MAMVKQQQLKKASSKCSRPIVLIYICLLYSFVQIYTLGGSVVVAVAAQQIAQQKADIETLKFVHLIWRHGVRTPVTDMAKEPRKWKQGYGELTSKGMGQLYRLGQWFRRRYDGGFLSPDYNSFETYVRSSDFNRTLMSAQALLAGLYPPRPGTTFEPGLNWQPIPVHTEPRETDRVIFDGTNCEPMAAEDRRMYNSAEVKALEHDNADFLRFLALQSGFKQNPLPFREIRYVFDALTCIKLNGEGQELPKWANESVIERVWQLNDISSSFLYNTTKLVRFRAGVLFTEILQRMKNVQRGFGDTYDARQRVHAYSAHDTTLAGMLAAFGLPPTPFPHFATALLIELHQSHHLTHLPSPTGSSTHFIRLFYRNETDVDTLWELPLPDCPSPCTVDRLEHVHAAILSTKEEQQRECAAGSFFAAKFVWSDKINGLTLQHRELIYIALITVLLLFCMSMFVYIVCCSMACCCSHRRKVFSLESNGKNRKKNFYFSVPLKFFINFQKKISAQKRQWKRRKMKWAHVGGATASRTSMMEQPLLPLEEVEGGGTISSESEAEEDDQRRYGRGGKAKPNQRQQRVDDDGL